MAHNYATNNLVQVYETLLYLLTPFILPISLIVQPALCGYLVAGTVGLYVVNSIIFNELHLRLKKERVSYMVLIFYYVSSLVFQSDIPYTNPTPDAV